MNKAQRWAPLAVALWLPLSGGALAGDHGCRWKPGFAPGPMTFIHRFGTLYVPRDAPIGAVIGTEKSRAFLNREGNNATVQCWWDQAGGKPAPEFTSTPVVPMASPPANPGGSYDPQRLLETDAPGIAVQIEYDQSIGYSAGTWLRSADGGPAIAPQHGEMRYGNAPTFHEYAGGNAWFTVVKTGALPAGPLQVTPRTLYRGNFTDIPDAFTFATEGTIIVAQCSVGSNAPVEVDLLRWDQSHFTAPGTVTTAVPVTLALHSCLDDPNNGVATVHAHFTPKDGSQVVGDPAEGVISLGNGATAKGVAIRLLKADLSPMPLNTTTPVSQLPPSGNLDLAFAAQIIQTAPANQVTAGTVEGMLEFTLTYQ
ncbi:fimbrial protein [Pseudomonas sp. DC3000-4b1]|uniref:fimbrial protein n=1 Tax=unclassified Pseudomonas TaxID=196821 RepID=UPI003CF322B6